jgi:nitroimidazol reductase NimA-like FMN-containing flavoprotein (pyridoxamine 5'-phosphate oxidase superfamily)
MDVIPRGPLTLQQIHAFLARPLIARMATTAGKLPHVVPVWYEWDGIYLWITIDRRSRKYRNLRINPTCAVTIDESQGGLRFIGVILEGSVELIEEPVEWAREFVRRVYTRYLGVEGVEARTPQHMLNEGQHAIVKLTPRKILTWDDTHSAAPVG